MTEQLAETSTAGRFPLSEECLTALAAAGVDADALLGLVDRALTEDLGVRGDVTSAATVTAQARITARYAARADGTAAGLPVIGAVVEHCLGPTASLRQVARDGDRLHPGDVLAEIEGPALGVLVLERLTLNLLGHLSGIATATREWVDAVEGTSTRIRDTRKTTPGLRDLEKYAVRCGGGVNHRRGLDDAVLIKDNHVAAAGGVGAALDRVHAAYPAGSMVVQVEVDNLDQLDEALEHGAVEILLDNFSEPDTITAVARVRRRSSGVLLEASGGLQVDRAARLAHTGVDFLSVGALTHSARSLDIGLDISESAT